MNQREVEVLTMPLMCPRSLMEYLGEVKTQIFKREEYDDVWTHLSECGMGG